MIRIRSTPPTCQTPVWKSDDDVLVPNRTGCARRQGAWNVRGLWIWRRAGRWGLAQIPVGVRHARSALRAPVGEGDHGILLAGRTGCAYWDWTYIGRNWFPWKVSDVNGSGNIECTNDQGGGEEGNQ
ncbi:hypothetical protein CC2G_013932 [Coprinopsis cinerea AmutBmut pab1-1]|nr:hypothetical protein CC2G_013932 [Coprinopsis cinerea AmutBmut pab1-1]